LERWALLTSLEPLRDRARFLRTLAPVRESEWVVYAKRPFTGPQQVLDYVGRYTHRVALSNNRLLDLADGQVSFRYKDYRHDAQQKTMTLAAEEFIRRFLLHVRPNHGPVDGRHNQNGERTASQRLLILHMLIAGKEHLKRFALQEGQQRAVLDAAPSPADHGMNVMAGQQGHEFVRYVFVKKDLQERCA
jgi:Putative transposase